MLVPSPIENPQVRHPQLRLAVSEVRPGAPLRPEGAMTEAMLRGWRAQQKARGPQESTIAPRGRLVRAFIEFTNEYPWN